MLLLNFCCISHISKEQIVDLVRHVKSLNDIFHPESGIYVLVGVAADVEVSWYLLNCEIASQPAAVLVLESGLGQLKLFLMMRLVE